MAGEWPAPAVSALRYNFGALGLAAAVALRHGRAGFVFPRPCCSWGGGGGGAGDDLLLPRRDGDAAGGRDRDPVHEPDPDRDPVRLRAARAGAEGGLGGDPAGVLGRADRAAPNFVELGGAAFIRWGRRAGWRG
jgi:hypothetical protein